MNSFKFSVVPKTPIQGLKVSAAESRAFKCQQNLFCYLIDLIQLTTNKELTSTQHIPAVDAVVWSMAVTEFLAFEPA